MAAKAHASSPARKSHMGKVFSLITGIVCFGFFAYVLFQIGHQIFVPPPAHRLIQVQDIPLPGGLTTSAALENSLAPGVAQDFDHFDFQALDVATHRLFVAHTGPNPDLLTQAHVKFNIAFDGHIIVFDTQQVKVIARINIPQVSGLVDAADLGKVFAASDTDQSIVYDIDVHTLKATPIMLNDLESPDAISYDPVDKTIFVSDPGAPADPNKTLNADPHNENVAVIDAVNDKLLKTINLGLLPLLPTEKVPANMIAAGNRPLYGHDVGHNKYDQGLQRFFVTSTVLPNADDPNPFVLPPKGTGEFFEIDPVNFSILQEINLPATCGTPHGMNIDETQQIGYIACTDVDAASNLFENLVRVDLKTMTVIPTDPNTTRLQGAPDIVVIDHPQGVLFVACKSGVSIFDIKPGEFHKLGDEIIGKGTHTLAVDEHQEVYLPIISGGIPLLRIARYNPTGSSR